MLVDMEVDGGNIILEFDVTVGDPQDGEIEGFAIAGEDRKFHPANVAYFDTGKDPQGRQQFDKRRLVLHSPMVSAPIHYRYAWGRNPLGNLQATGNKDLPFATQRSDDWPMEFVPKGIIADGSALPISRADRAKILQALRAQDRERRLAEAQAVLDSEG